jgi:hypothetical protein
MLSEVEILPGEVSNMLNEQNDVALSRMRLQPQALRLLLPINGLSCTIAAHHCCSLPLADELWLRVTALLLELLAAASCTHCCAVSCQLWVTRLNQPVLGLRALIESAWLAACLAHNCLVTLFSRFLGCSSYVPVVCAAVRLWTVLTEYWHLFSCLHTCVHATLSYILGFRLILQCNGMRPAR